METNVTIPSAGISVVGTLHMSDDLKPGEKRPAFITTHGFGGSRIDGSMAAVAPQLCNWGYLTLRFDSRGCGQSGAHHSDGSGGRSGQCVEMAGKTGRR